MLSIVIISDYGVYGEPQYKILYLTCKPMCCENTFKNLFFVLHFFYTENKLGPFIRGAAL